MMLGCKVATVVEQLEHIIYSASLMAIHRSLLWIPAVLCIQVECKKINFLASQLSCRKSVHCKKKALF